MRLYWTGKAADMNKDIGVGSLRQVLNQYEQEHYACFIREDGTSVITSSEKG